MPINFKKIEKVVSKTIQDLGEKATVTLQAPGTSDYDPTKPYEGPADGGPSYTVNAVVTPYEKSDRDVGVDFTRAQFTVFITGSALDDTPPSVGWLCILDGVKYRISLVSRTRPGTTVLLWKLVLER
jgi:hypothetical protein